MTKNKDLIKIDNQVYKKEAFMIEEDHPVLGRILIVEGIKFVVMDCMARGGHRNGTFLRKFTENDQRIIDDYDESLDELADKLKNKVDIKRLIKENIKDKSYEDIKTGLFILKAQENGEEVEEEHIKGCYNYNLHYKNQTFSFLSGCGTLFD